MSHEEICGTSINLTHFLKRSRWDLHVMCAPSSQVDTTLEHVDNVITVRISRENLDSENPLLLSQSMPWRQSETMSLNMKAFLNLEFGLIKT